MQPTRAHSVSFSPQPIPPIQTEELVQAYLDNDLERAKTLLTQGANPNAAYGQTRLFLLATATGNKPFVELLRRHGAIETEAETILAIDIPTIAPERCTMSEEELRRFLLQKKHLQKALNAPSGNTYLHELATDLGVKFSVFRHLTEADWEIKNSDGVSAFAYCCQKNPLHIIWDLVQYCCPFALLAEGLFSSLKAGKIDVSLFLLDKGVDPCITDSQSNTVLHTIIDAPLTDDIKIAEFVDTCIKKGAQINVKNSAGKTALLMAYDKRNMAVFQALLNNKPDLEVQDLDGETVLIKTIKRVDFAATRRLIQEGANRIDAQNKPLFTAIQSTNDAAMRMLVDKSITVTKPADPNGKNGEKQTPLFYIVQKIAELPPITDDALRASKEFEILDTLLTAGAKTTAKTKISSKKKISLIQLAQDKKLPTPVLMRLQASPRERGMTSLGSVGSLTELVRSTSQTPSPHSPNSVSSNSVDDVTDGVDALRH